MKIDIEQIRSNYLTKFRVYIKLHSNFDQDTIEDILQDTWIKIYNGAEKFNTRYKISTWLYSILRNTITDYYRRYERSKDFKSCYELEESISNEIILSDEREFIRNFINQLDIIKREVCYLYYYDGFKCREIATILKIPCGTVKYKLSEIRKQLRKEYQNEIT